MTCGLVAALAGLLGIAVGAAGTLLWLVATEDAEAHETPTEWPSRSGRPWDAP